MFKQLSVNPLEQLPPKASQQDESVSILLDGMTGSSDIKNDPVIVGAIKQGITGMDLSMLRRIQTGLTAEERRGFVLSLVLSSFGCSNNIISILVVGNRHSDTT